MKSSYHNKLAELENLGKFREHGILQMLSFNLRHVTR
jgi:hypothetical protein